MLFPPPTSTRMSCNRGSQIVIVIKKQNAHASPLPLQVPFTSKQRPVLVLVDRFLIYFDIPPANVDPEIPSKWL